MYRVILMSILLALSTVSHAEITSISSAINKAGRQRMLTQRMVKSYALVGIGVQEDIAQKQLLSAVALFDVQLNELKAYVRSEKIQRSLSRVSELWSPFKTVLLQPNNRNNAEILLESNDELLRACNKVVLQLQDESGSAVGRLVNISGRQRMLSQRLAKFYVLRAWGFNGAAIVTEEEGAKNEFNGALQELIRAPENTPEIKKELLDAQEQWELFEHGLKRNGDKLVPLIVAMTSEKVLIKMNEITGMYEKLPTKK